jgi:hypothetical protein
MAAICIRVSLTGESNGKLSSTGGFRVRVRVRALGLGLGLGL